jgi:hypothetical protein
MTKRFLTTLLFGALAVAALDGFELRSQNAANPAVSEANPTGQDGLKHGGNPWPPPPK